MPPNPKDPEALRTPDRRDDSAHNTALQERFSMSVKHADDTDEDGHIRRTGTQSHITTRNTGACLRVLPYWCHRPRSLCLSTASQRCSALSRRHRVLHC